MDTDKQWTKIQSKLDGEGIWGHNTSYLDIPGGRLYRYYESDMEATNACMVFVPSPTDTEEKRYRMLKVLENLDKKLAGKNDIIS